MRAANEAGITWERLQTRRWQRIATGTYTSARRRVTPLLLLAAACERLPPEAAFSGRSAGWLHGLDLPPTSPIDVVVPAGHAVAHRAGMRLHRVRLEERDIVVRHGLRVTAPLRTIADLGSAPDLTEAVIALDMALHAGVVSKAELEDLVDAAAGSKGVKRLRRAAALADIAESPMETRLRLLIVQAGLPAPKPQVSLFDRTGEFIARADLYYPSHRLCVEFDGGHHRETLVEDDRRQNRLADAGYRLLRFTSADVLTAPGRVAALVGAVLRRPPHTDFSPNPGASLVANADLDPNPVRGRGAVA